MKIEPLTKHPYLIPEIAKLKFKEFGYLIPNKTLDDYYKGLETHLNESRLPMAFVITENNQFIGIFSLNQHDMYTHQHLSPWIESVLVHPDRRNQGIGE